MRVLDVGCGNKPQGWVNVDLFIDDRHRKSGNHGYLRSREIPNLTLSDGCKLPFRDRSFKLVRCYHTIEHIKNWKLFLFELYRVTGDHLILICPDRRWLKFPSLTRSRTHINNFDKWTMQKAIELVLNTKNYEVKTSYRGVLHKLLPYPVLPYEVRADIWR